MSHATRTWISTGLLVLSALFIWIVSGDFPSQSNGYPGPGLFPRIIAIGLGISGLALLFGLKSPSQEGSEDRQGSASVGRLAGGVGLGILFPFLAPYLGLSVGAGIVCLGISFLFGLRWWLAITISLGTTGFLYLIFTLALGITV